MGEKGKKPELSDHLLTVHRRLHEALSLGMSAFDGKLKKWQSKDSDIQLHALKTMAAVLNCMTLTLLQHPLVQKAFALGDGGFKGALSNCGWVIVASSLYVFILGALVISLTSAAHSKLIL